MPITNNIFTYANKELSTDAFLAWFFIELEANEHLKPYLAHIFLHLGLVEEDEMPHGVEVALQDEKVDLMLTFKVSEISRSVLFENKVDTTFHSNQLEKYNDRFKNCSKYVYFKLGYIDVGERATVESQKYSLLSAKQMYEALSLTLPGVEPIWSNLIIAHYRDYLKAGFIDVEATVLAGVKNSDASIFSDAIAQKVVLGELYTSLVQTKDYTDFDLKFRPAKNIGGTPRVILSFCQHVVEAPAATTSARTESIWWRVDKRAKKPYLRMSQYLGFDKKDPEAVKVKRLRVAALRELIESICNEYPLVLGKPSLQVGAESELAILFFEDNCYADIKGLLPELTTRIQHAYRSFNSSTERAALPTPSAAVDTIAPSLVHSQK